VILCRVLGKAVASRKQAALEGAKLLVVAEVDPDGTERPDLHVVADTIGAGTGDLVLVVIGSAARLTEATRSQPIDALVIGVVDDVELLA
jgi:ethanolamine utilization protein EutN